MTDSKSANFAAKKQHEDVSSVLMEAPDDAVTTADADGSLAENFSLSDLTLADQISEAA